MTALFVCSMFRATQWRHIATLQKVSFYFNRRATELPLVLAAELEKLPWRLV